MKRYKNKRIIIISLLCIILILIIIFLIMVNQSINIKNNNNINNNNNNNYISNIDSNANLINNSVNSVENSIYKNNTDNTEHITDDLNQIDSNQNLEYSDSGIEINSSQIFKDINIDNIDNNELNNCVSTLYKTLYNGTNNKDITNINEFIKNNFVTDFYGSDKNVNNLVYRIYTTKQLDILNPDNIYINFESLNDISNIQSTYEFISFTASFSCHVIQYPPQGQEDQTMHEWDTVITHTIKISRDGKLISLVNII